MHRGQSSMLPAQPFQPQEPEAEHDHMQNPRVVGYSDLDYAYIEFFVLA